MSLEYKNFFENVILEYSENMMGDIFSVLKKETDDLSGIHFSTGVPARSRSGIDFGDKVGHLSFNKDPDHNDPIGIYAFPKDYVLSGELKKNYHFSSMKNYYILRPKRSKCKILNLGKISDNDLKKILTDMDVSLDYISDKSVFHKTGKIENNGFLLWGIMEKYRIDNNLKKNLFWNKLFKKSGYNLIYDPGFGIIHSNEKSQLIYLEPGLFDVVYSNIKKLRPNFISNIITFMRNNGYKVQDHNSKSIYTDVADFNFTFYNHEKGMIPISFAYSPGASYLNMGDEKYVFTTEYSSWKYPSYKHVSAEPEDFEEIIQYLKKGIGKKSNVEISLANKFIEDLIKKYKFSKSSIKDTGDGKRFEKFYYDKTDNKYVAFTVQYYSKNMVSISIVRLNRGMNLSSWSTRYTADIEIDPDASFYENLLEGLYQLKRRIDVFAKNDKEKSLKTFNFISKRVLHIDINNRIEPKQDN